MRKKNTLLKRILFLTALFGTGEFTFAQGEANIWYFGQNAGLDFNGGAPVALTNGQLIILEGSSSICDASGNLLFYTDGILVYNKNHQLMPNGTGLMGHQSTTQSALIVRKPGSASIYYIFTGDERANPNGIRYTEVDMTLNGGLGDVTANKNILLNTPSCEKITGILHCNRKDIWVVTHDWNSNAFRAYLVTAAGVNVTPVISNAGSVVSGNTSNATGQMKGSPDGKKIALANYYVDLSAPMGPQGGWFELFDFDNTTGIVSNPILFPQIGGNYVSKYGIEFSPDGTKLYGETTYNAFPSNTCRVYQWDLCAGSAAAIANSGVLIGTSASNDLGSLQLGPDGRIYLARWYATWLGVITNPNTVGVGCNYIDNGVSLAGRTSYGGLPNFIAPRQPIAFIVSDTCLAGTFSAPSVNITGCSGSASAISSLSWNFGDPASGANNTATTNNPTHTFTGAGSYTVSLVLNYACGSDTIKQSLIVSSCGFSATTTATHVFCNAQCNGTATANPSAGISPYTYQWSTLDTTQSITGLCAGNYTITITDSSSTTSTATITITEPAVLTAATTFTATSCGGNTGSATVTASGGTSGYAYSWNTTPTQTTQTATGLGAGNYTATVTDANGCTQTQTVAITSSGTFSVSASSTQTGCTINNGTATATSSSGTAPYTYLWDNGQATQTATGLAVGNYTATVTDAAGCTGTQTVNVTETTGTAVVAAASPTGILLGNSTTLSASGGVTYQWFPASDLSCTSCQNPVATPTINSIYCVIVTDTNNCIDTACVTVSINEEPVDCDNAGAFYLPNAFSPNADEENDLLKIYYDSRCIKTFKLIIYDRWGEKIYETTNPAFTWDGDYKDKPQTTAVFVYSMEAEFLNGEQITRKGNISLIK